MQLEMGITPPAGAATRRPRRLAWPGGGKLKAVVEWALQGCGRGGKGSLDEEQIFIRDGELFG
jgi:hypothetical protein